MMVLRVTIVAATAALLAVGPGGAAPPGAGDSRELWQGPVLAGDAVVWGEQADATASLHLWAPRGGERVVYSDQRLNLTGTLAASPTRLAFERSYPSCAPQPNVVCPQAQDALAGPSAGPFTTLAPPRTCSVATIGNELAVDGGVAAYLEPRCGGDGMRVLVRDVAHHGRSILLADTAGAGDVAIAGRYVAWSDRRGGDVVVYDRLARRVSYRARVSPGAAVDVDLGLDVQRDGKLAVSYRPIEVARAGPTAVAWLSPSAPRPHVLPLRGSDTRVRIADDRIAFVRFLTAKTSALVVADLAGRARTVARFVPPVRFRSGFDFDGRAVAWASDRVTATRVDCPPPGQGRPCVLRESGLTTIWRRAEPTGGAHVVARLPFVDEIARGGAGSS